MFNKLQFIAPNIFNITKRKEFIPELNLCGFLDQAFEFAYSMTFGADGHHRIHRTGGIMQRALAEQFINVFQGKLAEFGIYKKLIDAGIPVNQPDLRIMGKGLWDDSDFICSGKKLSVKSVAHFSNLLLLEQQDWDANGAYIPNLNTGNSFYDYFILVRIKPDGKQIIYEHKAVFYENEIDKVELKRLMINGKNWFIDVPGYITNQDFMEIINNNFILPQKALLNGKIEMDAANYYIQSGDLKPFNNLLLELNHPIT